MNKNKIIGYLIRPCPDSEASLLLVLHDFESKEPDSVVIRRKCELNVSGKNLLRVEV